MGNIECYRARDGDAALLTPLVDALRERASAAARAAALHLVDARNHPLPGRRGSLEALLVERAMAAPAAQRDRLRARLGRRGPAPLRPRLGGSSGVFQVGDRLAAALIDRARVQLAHPDEPPRGRPTALELRGLSLRCAPDAGDWSSDEIDLAAVITVYDDDAEPAGDGAVSLAVGGFRDAHTFDLQRRVLGSLPLPDRYPCGAVISLLLLERDLGGPWGVDTLRELKAWAENEVQGFIAHRRGDEGLLAALVLGAPRVVDAVVGPLLAWLGDDVFEPASLGVLVPGPELALPTTGPEVLDLVLRDDDGEVAARYQLRCEWHLR